MAKLLVLLAVMGSLILVACGSGKASATNAAFEGQGAEVIREVEVVKEVVVEKEVMREMAVGARAPIAEMAPSAAMDQSASSSVNLEIAERKVISRASIALEVEVVEEATREVRLIAEGLGGFVEQLSTSGEPERQRASLTVRVPQSQFFAALDSISALGEVRDQNVGSEDVSEQFIDLEARLKSSLREEKSLLSLLERAEKVSEVLTIERELSRVRSQVERLQGQLNFLQRRVDLATISVSLFSPHQDTPEPPSASLTLEVSDVTGSVERVKSLVASLDGKLDRVFISVSEGKERAEVTLRIFIPDFDRSLASIEGEGRVKTKQLQEGTAPSGGDAKMPREPNARIEASFLEVEDGIDTRLVIAIAAPTGGVALAALLGLLLYVTYRAGRRRARAS